jgi:CheY-like chemotaxis protein
LPDKIMIVDDDRITINLLQTLLELDGFEVILAPDGATAYQKAKDVQPDAFLVDYHLTGLEGTDFVRQLRADEQFKRVPIVMTSGREVEEEALACGANRFLIKPFDPFDLVSILQEMLGKKGN